MFAGLDSIDTGTWFACVTGGIAIAAYVRARDADRRLVRFGASVLETVQAIGDDMDDESATRHQSDARMSMRIKEIEAVIGMPRHYVDRERELGD